MFISGVIL